ncbi:hypothetical protein RUM44_000214 [Polyplax serrata]|uniref:Uncharacterized protein n=1 Tax=Polyplax serrata TaxID=468196 RepID=A0ABR1B4V5_POLSC
MGVRVYGRWAKSPSWTGHIRTSTGNYFIEPSEQSTDHAKPIEHIIYAMSGDQGLGKEFQHCGLVGEYSRNWFQVRCKEVRRALLMAANMLGTT